jgi:hypothetical protein
MVYSFQRSGGDIYCFSVARSRKDPIMINRFPHKTAQKMQPSKCLRTSKINKIAYQKNWKLIPFAKSRINIRFIAFLHKILHFMFECEIQDCSQPLIQ